MASSPRRVVRRRIPRILHQIYLGGTLATELRDNVDDLKRKNPDWEHRLYDEHEAEKFITRHYGREVLDRYLRIDPHYRAARADLLRHLILYKAGGVYCDMRSSFDRPLDESIHDEDRYLLAQWHNGPGQQNDGWGLHRDLVHVPGGEFMTHFIICEPGHAFSDAVIRSILQNIDQYRPWSAVGRTGVLRTTGPIAYTLAIWPILHEHPHRLITAEELGARYWIGKVFKHVGPGKHYSTLDTPVVRLGRAQAALSRIFVGLRWLKRELGFGWRHGRLQQPAGTA
jgi:mannosyltransferase OCH1-like enzyme